MIFAKSMNKIKEKLMIMLTNTVSLVHKVKRVKAVLDVFVLLDII